MRTLNSLALSSACVILLSACGGMQFGTPRYISTIRDQGPIALVSFGLDNAVMPDDDKNVATEQDAEAAGNELGNFRQAIATVYTQFKPSYAKGLGGHPVTALALLENDAAYQEKYRPKEKKLLGLSFTNSSMSMTGNDPEDQQEMHEAGYSTPDKIYRLNTLSDTKSLDQLAKDLNAGLLLFLDFKGSYTAAPMNFGKVSPDEGVLDLSVRMKLYQPGKGVVWKHTISNRSNKTAHMGGKRMASEYYPALIADAAPGLIQNIQQVFAIMQGTGEPKTAQTSKP